jgi:peroxiredoxin
MGQPRVPKAVGCIGRALIPWRAAVMTFALASTALTGQDSVATLRLDVQRLGPQRGERAPDFTLPDQFGQPRSLTSLMGPKGLMLVFYQSADWNPFCRTQLAELQQKRAEISAAGFGLAAISYDEPVILADFAGRRNITFPLLYDSGSEIIRRYGIFNTTVPESDRKSYGIPFPGTFIIARDGRVESRAFVPASQERVTASTMLMKLGAQLAVPVTTVSTPQATLTSFATDSVVAPGSVFALVVDGMPSAGMHVYAPGVTGYVPLALEIDSTTGLRVKVPAYPPPEIYHFAPLDERVPVYQGPFRVVQEVVLDAAFGGALTGELVIRGTLRYQACSDSICFPPRDVPMTWRVTVRRLDREGAPR